MIKKIANDIADLVEVKDRNYNGAFDKSCDKFRDYGVSKLYEKYERIYFLSRNENETEESIEDSLMDLVGYSLLMLRRIKKQGDDLDGEF